MKNWINADVVELNIAATAQGGKNLENADNNWTDQNGNAWTSYASGGNFESDDKIQVEIQ